MEVSNPLASSEAIVTILVFGSQRDFIWNTFFGRTCTYTGVCINRCYCQSVCINRCELIITG